MADLTDDEIRALLYVKETMVLAEECLRLRAELKEAVAWVHHVLVTELEDAEGEALASFLAKHKETKT